MLHEVLLARCALVYSTCVPVLVSTCCNHNCPLLYNTAARITSMNVGMYIARVGPLFLSKLRRASFAVHYVNPIQLGGAVSGTLRASSCWNSDSPIKSKLKSKLSDSAGAVAPS